MKRRSLLAAAGGALLSGAAGCIGVLHPSGSRCEPLEDDREVDGEWATFGFDTANTGNNPQATGPVGAVQLRWCFSTPMAIRSTPAVSGGTVYVTSTAPARDEPGSLTAVDAATGAEEWSIDLGFQPSSTPTVIDRTVYVGNDAPGAIIAVDADDGTEEWSFDVGDRVESNPTVADGTVFVGSRGGTLHAVDAVAGTEQWRFDAEDAIDRTPAIVDDVLYVASRDHHVYAVDADDGSEVWRTRAEEMVLSSPTVHERSVYVGDRAGFVHALSVADGSTRWRRHIDDLDGSVTGLRSSGENDAIRPLGTDHPQTGASSSSRLAGGDDRPDPDDSDRPAPPGPSVNTSPAVAGDTVVVGSHAAGVHALSTVDGSLRWDFETDHSVGASPVIGGDTVFVGVHSGLVHAPSLEDGTESWRYDAGNWITESPSVVDDLLFVGNDAATLYCLESAEA